MTAHPQRASRTSLTGDRGRLAAPVRGPVSSRRPRLEDVYRNSTLPRGTLAMDPASPQRDRKCDTQVTGSPESDRLRRTYTRGPDPHQSKDGNTLAMPGVESGVLNFCCRSIDPMA